MEESIIKIIMDLISNGLFPIACCGALAYGLIVIFKAYREDSKATTEAVNNNTLALTKLVAKLEKESKKND